MRPKNHRKSIWIDRRLQSRIVLSSLIPMAVCLAGVSILDVYYRRGLASGVIPSDGTFLGLPEERAGMVALAIAACCLQLATALRMSQRVAGTSYSIRRVLEAFRTGDRSARVRLRTDDYQLALGDDLNEFLRWVDGGRDSERGAEAVSAEGMEKAGGAMTAAVPATAGLVVDPTGAKGTAEAASPCP